MVFSGVEDNGKSRFAELMEESRGLLKGVAIQESHD